MPVGELLGQDSAQQGIVGVVDAHDRRALQAAGQIGQADRPCRRRLTRGQQKPPVRRSQMVVQVEQVLLRRPRQRLGILDRDPCARGGQGVCSIERRGHAHVCSGPRGPEPDQMRLAACVGAGHDQLSGGPGGIVAQHRCGDRIGLRDEVVTRPHRIARRQVEMQLPRHQLSLGPNRPLSVSFAARSAAGSTVAVLAPVR